MLLENQQIVINRKNYTSLMCSEKTHVHLVYNLNLGISRVVLTMIVNIPDVGVLGKWVNCLMYSITVGHKTLQWCNRTMDKIWFITLPHYNNLYMALLWAIPWCTWYSPNCDITRVVLIKIANISKCRLA